MQGNASRYNLRPRFTLSPLARLHVALRKKVTPAQSTQNAFRRRRVDMLTRKQRILAHLKCNEELNDCTGDDGGDSLIKDGLLNFDADLKPQIQTPAEPSLPTMLLAAASILTYDNDPTHTTDTDNLLDGYLGDTENSAIEEGEQEGREGIETVLDTPFRSPSSSFDEDDAEEPLIPNLLMPPSSTDALHLFDEFDADWRCTSQDSNSSDGTDASLFGGSNSLLVRGCCQQV